MTKERNYEADLQVTFDEMALPAGHTCDDCGHFRYCSNFIGDVKGNTHCDWAPSRFTLAIVKPGLRHPHFTRLIQPMSFLMILAALMVVFALCRWGK